MIGQRAGHLDDYRPGPVPADFSARRILYELRQVQPDPDFAGTHEILDPRVSDPRVLLGVGYRRWRQQRCHHEQSAQTLFHDIPPSRH
jgi:hypothetical protein